MKKQLITSLLLIFTLSNPVLMVNAGSCTSNYSKHIGKEPWVFTHQIVCMMGDSVSGYTEEEFTVQDSYSGGPIVDVCGAAASGYNGCTTPVPTEYIEVETRMLCTYVTHSSGVQVGIGPRPWFHAYKGTYEKSVADVNSGTCSDSQPAPSL